MANKIKGSNVMIYRHNPDLDEDYLFACMRNAELVFEVDEKITNSQSSAFWEEAKPSISRWMINGDGLMVLAPTWNYLYMVTDLINRERFIAKFVIDNGTPLGLTIFQGTVFFKSFVISAPYGDIATYTVSMKGSGQPSLTGTVVTPSGTTVIAGTAISVVNIKATEGQTTFTISGGIGKTLIYASRGSQVISPMGAAGDFNSGITWDSVTGVATVYIPAVGDESFIFLLQ